jgi:hypothetical protein
VVLGVVGGVGCEGDAYLSTHPLSQRSAVLFEKS